MIGGGGGCYCCPCACVASKKRLKDAACWREREGGREGYIGKTAKEESD